MRARGLPSSSATLPEASFLFSELSSYLKREDVSELQNVYLFSQSAHSGQFRQSGEPYISHPLAVAEHTRQIASRYPDADRRAVA